MDWHCSPFVIPAEERRSRSKSRDKGLTASILGHCVGVKGHTSQRAARLSRLAPFGLGRDDKSGRGSGQAEMILLPLREKETGCVRFPRSGRSWRACPALSHASRILNLRKVSIRR